MRKMNDKFILQEVIFQVKFWVVVSEKQLCDNILFIQFQSKIILKFDVYHSKLFYIHVT